MELASQIRERRIKLGISQDELAERIYVSRQTISSWENDKTYPDVQSLLMLSVLFETTVDELIKGDVVVMQDVISKDLRKVYAWSLVGLAVALLGVVAIVSGISVWKWDIAPSAIIGLLIWGIGLGMTIKGSSILKKHDLVTYQEMVAFSKGEPIDRDNPKSQRARSHRLLKFILTMVIAMTLGGILGYYSYVLGLFG
ncbi:MAG: helix-turn-helix transcriptional regulator [Raoultibacter sp.]